MKDVTVSFVPKNRKEGSNIRSLISLPPPLLFQSSNASSSAPSSILPPEASASTPFSIPLSLLPSRPNEKHTVEESSRNAALLNNNNNTSDNNVNESNKNLWNASDACKCI
mmetsp:Transcript_8229/g.9476  ORF Transcript_8229/g.9476 Transcript_8229/m.9476 type:complete len:111 (+) Transcript_8229:222-554(+)